jgi:ElaB/YqjD/DUF883 family membrane-anchored ribosome-binding protein
MDGIRGGTQMSNDSPDVDLPVAADDLETVVIQAEVGGKTRYVPPSEYREDFHADGDELVRRRDAEDAVQQSVDSALQDFITWLDGSLNGVRGEVEELKAADVEIPKDITGQLEWKTENMMEEAQDVAQEISEDLESSGQSAFQRGREVERQKILEKLKEAEQDIHVDIREYQKQYQDVPYTVKDIIEGYFKGLRGKLRSESEHTGLAEGLRDDLEEQTDQEVDE